MLALNARLSVCARARRVKGVEMYESINEQVGARIKYLREKRLNISREEFARRLDISRPSVANIEEGRQNITLVQLMVFSGVLGVSFYDLLPGEREALSIDSLADALPAGTDSDVLAWVKTL